jgi:hypothetical protein
MSEEKKENKKKDDKKKYDSSQVMNSTNKSGKKGPTKSIIEKQRVYKKISSTPSKETNKNGRRKL